MSPFRLQIPPSPLYKVGNQYSCEQKVCIEHHARAVRDYADTAGNPMRLSAAFHYAAATSSIAVNSTTIATSSICVDLRGNL